MIRVLLFFTLFLFSCKSKDKKPAVKEADFFPVSAYLKGEISRLDTSLFSFTKIEIINGVTDSLPIKNSEVKQYAKDLLTIPDISKKELKDDYDITHLYDDLLNAFVFTFTTKANHPVKREDVMLDPEQNAQGKNDVKSIFVELWQDSTGEPVRKNIFWEANKSFQVVTFVTNPTGGDSVKKLQVIWNGFVTPNQ